MPDGAELFFVLSPFAVVKLDYWTFCWRSLCCPNDDFFRSAACCWQFFLLVKSFGRNDQVRRKFPTQCRKLFVSILDLTQILALNPQMPVAVLLRTSLIKKETLVEGDIMVVITFN